MTTMERRNRMIKGVSDKIQNRFLKEVLDLEEKLTGELFEANDELITFNVENVEREERRISDTSRSVEAGGRCQGHKALQVKLDLNERQDGGARGSSGLG